MGLPVLPEVYCRKASSPALGRARDSGWPVRAQFACSHHCAQSQRTGLQQSRRHLRFRQGKEHAGATVGKDAGLTPQMVLQLRGAQRGVKRHRYAAREQNAEEREEIVAPGGQHDRHGLPRLQAVRLQAGSEDLGLVAQFEVSDRFFR